MTSTYNILGRYLRFVTAFTLDAEERHDDVAETRYANLEMDIAEAMEREWRNECRQLEFSTDALLAGLTRRVAL